MPTDEPFKFRHRVRVRFVETDAQGVVYHSNFLVYCEVARVEYARMLFGAHHMRNPTRFDLVIAHASLDFHRPARFDDEIEVRMRLARAGRSSYELAYAIHLVDEAADHPLLCRAKTVQVAIDRETRKPVALPDEYLAPMLAYEPAPPTRT